jgi:hypothetical protein
MHALPVATMELRRTFGSSEPTRQTLATTEASPGLFIGDFIMSAGAFIGCTSTISMVA